MTSGLTPSILARKTSDGLTMTHIYCSKITPKTQEDVNLAFRDNNIPAELFVGDDGAIYVAPVLSWTRWAAFPQSDISDQPIAEGWDNAIQDGLAFMSQNGWLDGERSAAHWQQFDVSMRCPKMEAYQRALDVPRLTELMSGK